MNFDKYLEIFKGNKEEAIKTLAESEVYKNEKYVDNETRKNLIKGLKGNDANLYARYLVRTLKDDPEFARDPKSAKKQFSRMMFLHMSFEEIKNAKKNPFKARTLKGLLALLIGGAIFTAAGVFLPGISTALAIPGIKAVAGVLYSTILMSTGLDFARYFVFKKFEKEAQLNNSISNEQESKKIK